MPQNKEVHRKYMEDRRKVHKTEGKGSQITEVHTKGSQQLFRYIDGKKVLLDKLPPGYKVLSDGQVWKPLHNKPKAIVKPVEGTTTEKVAKLLLICQSLNKHDVAHEVRYGVNGPTMDIVSETLGAS